jgi:hypothetical protein
MDFVYALLGIAVLLLAISPFFFKQRGTLGPISTDVAGYPPLDYDYRGTHYHEHTLHSGDHGGEDGDSDSGSDEGYDGGGGDGGGGDGD